MRPKTRDLCTEAPKIPELHPDFMQNARISRGLDRPACVLIGHRAASSDAFKIGGEAPHPHAPAALLGRLAPLPSR